MGIAHTIIQLRRKIDELNDRLADARDPDERQIIQQKIEQQIAELNRLEATFPPHRQD